jgi:uncharacterized protein
VDEKPMKTISITSGTVSGSAELNDSNTAQKIWAALPIEGSVNRWGDEIYFSIPVKLEQESQARADVEVGELGYWAPGSAFCIFFGATPASSGSKPRAASPVNVFGNVKGDATLFKKIKDGASIKISKAE